MRIIFLGTSAALPTRNRGLSCICIEREGEILMFDAGEGAQMAYLRAGLGWNKPMRIFITHMHGDHCIGILGMLQTMSMKERTRPLEIYGPAGIDEFLAENIRILNFGVSFPVMISTVDQGEVVGAGAYSVLAHRAAHSVEAYSYVLEEGERPGRFHRDRAEKLGVPEGELWGRLQAGRQVVVDGRTVGPADVMGPPRRGRKIGISGDTRPTPQLEEFFRGCDYLVFDSTFADRLRERAIETFHSTAAEAATLARNAGVSHLILTHFSARHGSVVELAGEAGAIHGSVTAAEDLLEIEVGQGV